MGRLRFGRGARRTRAAAAPLLLQQSARARARGGGGNSRRLRGFAGRSFAVRARVRTRAAHRGGFRGRRIRRHFAARGARGGARAGRARAPRPPRGERVSALAHPAHPPGACARAQEHADAATTAWALAGRGERASAEEDGTRARARGRTPCARRAWRSRRTAGRVAPAPSDGEEGGSRALARARASRGRGAAGTGV